MLAQRVVTAVVMLAVLLGALLAPQPWILVALLVVVAASALWEWLRLTWPAPSSMPLVCALIVAAVFSVLARQWLAAAPQAWFALLLSLAMRWLLPAVAAVWVLGGVGLVVQGRSSARSGSVCLGVFGIAAVAAAWLALVQLFLRHGAWFLVSLLALVWFADIAAYFSGKAFGRRKLAPRVSPGKTWEGAAGGVLAATVWIVASSFVQGSFGFALRQRWSWTGIIVIAIGLAALSIIGDLFESLLKRRAGVKDSSGLLPGHGGVYDRIDALLPVAPVAFLLIAGWQ